MESALQEAKALVQRMETFLESNESSVKKFLEDQKKEILNSSRPRIMKAVDFDQSNIIGEEVENRSNQDEDVFGNEIIEIGVSPRVDNFSARIPELELVPALVEVPSTSKKIRNFEWPKSFDVQNFPLDKKIKLVSFSYQASNFLSAI